MRQPKPFYRNQTQSWYVQIGKKQIPLGKDEKAAWEKYHEIMAKRRKAEPTPDDSVCNVLNRYLGWCKDNRSEATFDKTRRHLKRFAHHIGPQLRISQLKKRHVQEWIDRDYVGKSSTYQNTAITAVVTALNWALELDYIDQNPVAGIKKPKRRVREFYLPPEKWNEIVESIRDQEFRDYFVFMVLAGTRPQETRKIEARHYDQPNSRIIFGREEAKGKKRPRTIYLDDTAQEIVERLVKQHSNGAIFRNTKGRPWTKNSINCRFRRLKKKFDLPEICAYSLRHSFSHWKLVSGVEPHFVSKLLGHTDGRMLETRYGHVEKNSALMLQKASQTGNPFQRPPSTERSPDSAPDTDQGLPA